MRKFVLGIQAQANSKNLTRPFMPSAPRRSCVRCVITSSRLYTTPSVTLRRHKAAAASSSSSARALNYEYADGVDYRGLTAFASLSMAVSAGLNTTMQKIRDNYATLIELAHSKLPTATIFIHSYDHPIPDSKALRQPMRTCKVPVDLQRPLATELFDRLADLMNAIASTSDKIEFVDCRNTLTDNDWLNELHPTPLGFDKLAGPWEIALRKRGFLSPR
ncbi:hypothetical protein [Candidatus Reidiella endopervernicosa]|uniref:SGNH/GDSL hydrolase family protein n=1 Tax=Candidatus Reidiella endopervernicosa TaxID=2738883 RepID=A0A6N0HZL8_9GAMM|nr:hypothetical protein [Candidatus Reidiella endopervernicosa]QKQ27812.1 hypothetical protein HUE57_17130 [Candidatus Reidiella endopervernicosa]